MNFKEFCKLWDVVIMPEAIKTCNTYADLFFAEYVKEEMFDECIELIEHGKRRYMKNRDEFLDRHKIAAAVMISILKTTPIKIVGPIHYTAEPARWGFNEHLAITAGLSVLKAFIITDVRNKYSHDKETMQNKLKELESDIKFPVAKHGDYRDNWANELYYTRKDGSYNLLALAHELFLLEIYTIEY